MRDEIQYTWVDTCCIDKSSSAELSEAINSMFKWYRHAGICYAYLDDIEPENVKNKDRNGLKKSYLGQARWFTRGWTLQELIAPKEVVFYTNRWVFMAKKTKIVKMLENITGINMQMWVSNGLDTEATGRITR